jgi:ABC-2 type transport system ATP-binding protein
LLSCALAPVAGAETKLSYMVPVTQPDELGQPVSIDTDVWIPSGKRPAGGWPMVLFFHGGGGSKASSFDAGHAAVYARHGYVTALYSARGHGESGGQTSVTGPKEMRDTFDVLAWMTGAGGRNQPAHPNWHINRRKLGF